MARGSRKLVRLNIGVCKYIIKYFLREKKLGITIYLWHFQGNGSTFDSTPTNIFQRWGKRKILQSICSRVLLFIKYFWIGIHSLLYIYIYV